MEEGGTGGGFVFSYEFNLSIKIYFIEVIITPRIGDNVVQHKINDIVISENNQTFHF